MRFCTSAGRCCGVVLFETVRQVMAVFVSGVAPPGRDIGVGGRGGGKVDDQL